MLGKDTRRIGLILAAGRGRRMGGKKQIAAVRTPQGKMPLVAAAFDAIAGVCDEMVVVLGHDAKAVAAALAPRLFHQVKSDPDAEMIESIQGGLAAAGELDSAATIVLQPGDHPWVAPATLTALLAATAEYSDRAILPEYNGRGGHPVFIPSALAARLVREQCPGGLGVFWSEHPQLVRRLAVDDRNIIRDVDTPEQLAE